MIYLILYSFLVYPVSTDDINIDSRGLFYCISPWPFEHRTIYLYTNPWLSWGPRNTNNPKAVYWASSPYDAMYGQFVPRLKDRHWYGVGNARIGFVPLRSLTVFLGIHGYGNYIERANEPSYRLDTRLVEFPHLTTGVKISFPTYLNGWELGFGVFVWGAMWSNLLVPVRFEDTGNIHEASRKDEFRPIYKNNLEIGIRILTGLKTPVGTTFVNLGILNIQSEEGGNRTINSFGIGQEFNIWERFRPAIEIAHQDSFLTLIPQLKIFIPYLDINVGLGFSLKKNIDWTPDYGINRNPKIMVALNPKYTIKIKPKPKPTIIIAGAAIDTIINQPIPVTITYMGPASGKKTFNSGNFRLKFVHPGAYRVGFESEGYLWKEFVYRAMPYDTIEQNIYMTRVIDWSIMGKVLDRETNTGAPAEVMLKGKTEQKTYTDPATGEYKLFTPAPGEYELIVKGENYITQKIKVTIDNKTTVIKDVSLLPKKTKKPVPTEEKPPTTPTRPGRRR